MKTRYVGLKRRLITVFLAGVLPLLFTLCWLSVNHQLPGNDAANYLMSAVTMYQHFTDHGVLRGIFHFYTERGWRPIAFPNMAVPFLLLSSGDLSFAYHAVAILCMLASTLYCYLFFRLQLARFPALLGANLIGLLPFVQAQALQFYAEAALFPCVIGALYHFIQSEYFRHRKHSVAFVLLLSFALMIRPVETVTNMLFVMMLLFYAGWRQKQFSIEAIRTVIFLGCLSALLFFAAAYLSYWRHGGLPVIDGGGPQDVRMQHVLALCLLGSGLMSVVMGIVSRKRLGNQPIVIVFAAIFALTLLWFLPFAFNTYEWIYRTSLGDVASNTGSLSGASFSFDVLMIYLREEGLAIIGGTLLVALIGWFAITWPQRKALFFSQPVLCLLLLLPFPFWEAFYTVQIVTRKLSLVFPAVLMALLFFALAPGKWFRTRCVLVSGLIIMQLSLLICLLFTNSYQQPRNDLMYSIGYFIPQPSTIQPNPHALVIDFFTKEAAQHHLQSIGLELIPGTPDARHPVEAEPINPFLMATMLQAKKTSFYAGYPYYSDYSDANLHGLAKRYDAIFLSDPVSDMLVSPTATLAYEKKFNEEKSASIKLFYKIMTYYSSAQLAQIGFNQGPCIVIKTQKKGNYLGCLLFSATSH